MAKVISQETFDDVVKENIVEFSMDIDEAREETIKQFEAQGCNLSNIIKDLRINQDTGRPILNETVEQLIAFQRTGANDNELLELLNALVTEFKASVPHRVMAAKLNVQEPIHSIIEAEIKKPDREVLKKTLTVWNELISKQPDIFNDRSMILIHQMIGDQPSDEIISLALQHLKSACVLHEFNRQNIINANTLDIVKPLLKNSTNEVLNDTCALFRGLVADDDVRVEISKAPEHARIIASEVLVDLTKLLPEKMSDTQIFAELLLTIAALTVRQEFCVTVEEHGGIEHIYEGMKEHTDSIRVQKEAVKVLRALVGNDTVKSKILQTVSPTLFNVIFNCHKHNEPFAKAGLAFIATLTLRSTENSALLFEADIAETIVETMTLHKNSKLVQRNGAWAIRNMVSRSREQCPAFLTLGTEELLHEAIVAYADIEYDLKSALRDLGCDVKLKEEWTGVKNKLNISPNKRMD